MGTSQSPQTWMTPGRSYKRSCKGSQQELSIEFPLDAEEATSSEMLIMQLSKTIDERSKARRYWAVIKPFKVSTLQELFGQPGTPMHELCYVYSICERKRLTYRPRSTGLAVKDSSHRSVWTSMVATIFHVSRDSRRVRTINPRWLCRQIHGPYPFIMKPTMYKGGHLSAHLVRCTTSCTHKGGVAVQSVGLCFDLHDTGALPLAISWQLHSNKPMAIKVRQGFFSSSAMLYNGQGRT